MRFLSLLVAMTVCQVCQGDIPIAKIQVAANALPSDHQIFWFLDFEELTDASIAPYVLVSWAQEIQEETESEEEAEFASAYLEATAIIGSLDSIEAAKRAIIIWHSEFDKGRLQNYFERLGLRKIRSVGAVDVLQVELNESAFSLPIPIETPASTIKPVIRVAVVDDSLVLIEMGDDQLDSLLSKIQAKPKESEVPRKFWLSAIKRTFACVGTETRDSNRLLDERSLPDRIAMQATIGNGLDAEVQIDFPTDKRAKIVYDEFQQDNGTIDAIWKMTGGASDTESRALRELFTHCWKKCAGRRVKLGLSLPAECPPSATVTYLDDKEQPTDDRLNAKYIVCDSHHLSGTAKWNGGLYMQVERVVASFDKKGQPIEPADGYWKKVTCFATDAGTKHDFTNERQMSELSFELDGNVEGFEMIGPARKKIQVNRESSAKIVRVLFEDEPSEVKKGDEIVSVNGVLIRSGRHFEHEMWRQDLGRPAKLELSRNGHRFTTKNDGFRLSAATNSQEAAVAAATPSP